MREIKFRVWSDVWRELMFAISIDFNNKFVEVLPESELEGGSTQLVSFDQIHLMQFTELHDKNGVEIYESDKLINPKGEIGVVVWYEGGFYLKCDRKSGQVFYVALTRGFVANKLQVGNIYSNPELLEERAKV